jgi:hypothetical protein
MELQHIPWARTQMTQLSKGFVSLAEMRQWGKVKYMSSKYLFLWGPTTRTAEQSRIRQLLFLVCLTLTRKKICLYVLRYLPNFAQTFHCSGSAVCAVLLTETSTYWEIVTRRHGVTPQKPSIFNNTVVTDSNPASKHAMINAVRHLFAKFTCAK